MARKNAPEAGFASETVESIEHLAGSKQLKKAAKAERKAAKKAAKQRKKTGDEVDVDTPDDPKMVAKRARTAINFAKVVLPVAIPVVTPIAVRAAGAAREAYERYRARRLGVDIEEIDAYVGHGAQLNARISGLSDGLGELKAGGTAEGMEFAERATSTLRQLMSAVRAAERMPPARRKHAHRAVAKELDNLEATLLYHLGVDD